MKGDFGGFAFLLFLLFLLLISSLKFKYEIAAGDADADGEPIDEEVEDEKILFIIFSLCLTFDEMRGLLLCLKLALFFGFEI